MFLIASAIMVVPILLLFFLRIPARTSTRPTPGDNAAAAVEPGAARV